MTITPEARRPLLMLAILFTVISWGAAFIAIRIAVQEISPAALALSRFIIASIVLALYVLITRPEGFCIPRKKDWSSFLYMALTGIVIYQLALNIGQQTVDAGTASLLINTTPVFTMLMGHYLLGEQVRKQHWLGISIAFVGVITITQARGIGFTFDTATLLIILAALSSAAYLTLQRKTAANYNGTTMAVWSIWIATLLMLPASADLISALPTLSTKTTLSILYLGIFPSAIGYCTWAYVLTQIPVSRSSIYFYLIPPTALILGWLILDEIPTLITLFGGVLIILGIVIVNKKN